MHTALNDPTFLADFPELYHQAQTANLRLRSYLLTGDNAMLEEDDGGFPRIRAVTFEVDDAVRLCRLLGETPIGKRPKRTALPTVTLEIDYGNGYVESVPFSFRKGELDALFVHIRAEDLRLFRSLYGLRRQ